MEADYVSSKRRTEQREQRQRDQLNKRARMKPEIIRLLRLDRFWWTGWIGSGGRRGRA